MKNFRYLLLYVFLTPFLLLNNQCAKTKDVELVNDTSDTTVNNTDTIYYGFVLNEVLYDPPSGLDGDSNNDSLRDPNDDEFVEFVNDSDSIIDLSGYKIYDAERLALGTPNHEFPDGILINPGQAVVVFGGGTPSGNFGGAQVFTASNQVLNLTNNGDLMTLTDSLKRDAKGSLDRDGKSLNTTNRMIAMVNKLFNKAPTVLDDIKFGIVNKPLIEFTNAFESGLLKAGEYTNGELLDATVNTSNLDAGAYNPETAQDTVVDAGLYINV